LFFSFHELNRDRIKEQIDFKTMPAGESLGNALMQFNPMPGFVQGNIPVPSNSMAPPMPSMQEIERQKREQLLMQQMQARDAMVNQPLVYGQKPVNLDINAVEGGIESIGGTANIQLDPNQRLRIGANYMPSYVEQGVSVPQTYRVEAGYETPGLGINVNYRPRRMGMGGFGAGMNFNQRF